MRTRQQAQVNHNVISWLQIMIMHTNKATALMLGSALIIAAGFFPPTARFFEASMINHMLLQLPLLALAGAFVQIKGTGLYRKATLIDPYGGVALVLASGCLIFWMLPINLDLAVIDTRFRALKLLSVPLLIGLCLKWVWIRSAAIVKIVVMIEGWAAVTRLGWLYLESPEQLCSSYLIGEQRMVGSTLLIVSAVTGVIGLFWGIFGVFGHPDEPKLDNCSKTR